MTDTKETETKKRLGLARPSARVDARAGDVAQVRQSFPHGRTKTVQVEVKKKRVVAPSTTTASATPARSSDSAPSTGSGHTTPSGAGAGGGGKPAVLRALTEEERAARQRALKGAIRADIELRRRDDVEAHRAAEEEAKRKAEDESRRRQDEEERRKVEEALRAKAEEEAKRKADEEARKAQTEEDAKRRKTADETAKAAVAKHGAATPGAADEDESRARARRPGVAALPPKRAALAPRRIEEPRRPVGKVNLDQALAAEDNIRARSLAAIKRRAAKERQALQGNGQAQSKVYRDVVIPETITVQELANRMAERSVDVIKSLMKMGVMATINQTIDADTAELIVTEFGHKVKRVAESDVEIGVGEGDDSEAAMQPRAPVVTIMGHVDHGKTSLLDALRETDIAKHEAGGITQHIGAYQVTLKSGAKITFLDTPGHEAFTAMRARGASVTDLVVLVVAADDGIQPQTIEAINHAKAAKVPLIVAINKIDKPGANADKVRVDLLQHDVALEGHGGDVLAVEVSALKKTNLDKLVEAILLQSEILDLRANPDRLAAGTVVEAKLERGRGAVATVLVQKGTLRVGDIVVAGSEWGKVRALIDDANQQIRDAGPSMPVEILGLDGTPSAGDEFAVVPNEARAREVTSFRQKKARDARTATTGRGTLADMFNKIQEGTAKELGVVVKADVQGSVEAIVASIAKLGTDEVKTRVLHGAVGAITEGDVALAKASTGIIVGFNVRATAHARDIAKRDGVEIRYYSIIYDIIDDIKKALSGMLAPTLREKFLGNATIRAIFDVSKSGKVAGCMVTDGMVKRGAKVRLLRDNVVIHEGTLKTLRRFKDEVREVQSGYECGMAFENYQDIREGDVIEAFEIEEVARVL
jgi:translation initiation factor IF-2